MLLIPEIRAGVDKLNYIHTLPIFHTGLWTAQELPEFKILKNTVAETGTTWDQNFKKIQLIF